MPLPPCVSHGGVGGGGITNSGTLTINSSTISGNEAVLGLCNALLCYAKGGGISNGGTLTINNTTISDNEAGLGCINALVCDANGGGILNGGILTVTNSTLGGNRVVCSQNCQANGGGVVNVGTLRIVNSTFTGNSSHVGCTNSNCGGHALGGGINNASGTLVLNNVTLSGNSATISGCTALSCLAQGGGIYNIASATVQNSIVANSPSGGNCNGITTSHGHNLSSDDTCNFNGPGDMNNTDPMLRPLQNNGGPTQTMALPTGSPAIDAGNTSGCTDGSGHLLKTDQRGMPRPDTEDKIGCDMGAYERQSD